MIDQSNSVEDELLLGEILAGLWSHKLLIAAFTCFSIFLGGYYALNAKKKFTAKAVFQIETGNKAGFNLPGDLGALASIAGFATEENSDSEALLERISSREFILQFSESVSLESDTFFNTHDPDYQDPFWKYSLKKIIGWEETKAQQDAIIEHSILKNFKKYVKIQNTSSGSISVSLTHRLPKVAAHYTNSFMEEVRQLVEYENSEAQAIRLSYLSETLADALQDMDTAQQNLKEYALANSAMAQENFISGSLKLDELRMERRKVKEISDVLKVINNMIKAKSFDTATYETLRSNYPLVDDVDFRRILGMSETISAWSWPDIETIRAVSATLRDRIKRLEIEIKNIEDNAKIYATSAEDLAKFTRDAKIAEATYTVLIEQVKSQSLAAGFQPDTFKVFEYATPPLAPSSPKRSLVLALSAISGLILGGSLALINLMRRGTYYTKKALMSDARAGIVLNSKSFRKVSRWSLSKINSYMSKNRIMVIDEAEINLANKKLIFFINCGGRPTSSGTARLLANQSSASGRKVIICDKTGQSEKQLENGSIDDNHGSHVTSLGENLDILTGENSASFFTSSSFNSTIKKLMANYDQVYVCSNKNEAIMALMALEQFDPSIVLLARLRTTRKIDIKKITSNQTINLMFYD